MTDGTLTAVLQMECFSVQNLIEIAKELSINTYRAVPTSFRLSYKELGYAIQKELNVSFGMVEGMHRIYTVKNVLEGRYLPDCTEEPSLQNKFLGTKIKIRLDILDKINDVSLSRFSELSLLYMKVKGASVQRTLFDELTQIVNEIQCKNEVYNLREGGESLMQSGKHTKEGTHVLYNQRLFMYTFITSFALNDKKSTVLFKYQHDHVSQVLTKQHIPDKHEYLGLDKSIDLHDKRLHSVVNDVIMKNISIKAQEFTTLSIKTSSRNNDWSMKPLCSELRIVLSYYVLASMTMSSIEEATRIFSSNYNFQEHQTSRNIDILSTMSNIVNSIDSVVTEYRRVTGISANEIHATKIDQLLSMNIFQDIMDVIKRIGHNPNIKLDAVACLCHNIEEDVQQPVLVELLQAWKIKMGSYLKLEHQDTRSKWKDTLFDVCRGGNKITKSDVKKGIFATTDITAYSVNSKVLFSFFHNNVVESSLHVYDVSPETDDAKPYTTIPTSWDAIADDYVFAPTDDGFVASKVNINNNDGKAEETASRTDVSPEKGAKSLSQKKSDSNSSPSTTKKLAPVFEDQSTQKKRKSSSPDKKGTGRKNGKIDKRAFDVPEKVLSIYSGVVSNDEKKIPFDRDMDMIKHAWKSTIESLKTPNDLKKIWEIHQQFLFQHLLGKSCDTTSKNDNDVSNNLTKEISKDDCSSIS